MKAVLLVGFGSFIGGVLRYLAAQFVQIKSASDFPLGTLVVNVTGCLIIGVVIALSERSLITHEWRLFLATGICGGFTTFSAFSLETFSLLHRGQTLTAFIYLSASLLLGVAATFFGIYLTKQAG